MHANSCLRYFLPLCPSAEVFISSCKWNRAKTTQARKTFPFVGSRKHSVLENMSMKKDLFNAVFALFPFLRAENVGNVSHENSRVLMRVKKGTVRRTHSFPGKEKQRISKLPERETHKDLIPSQRTLAATVRCVTPLPLFN